MTVVFPLSALKGLPGHVRADQLKALLRHTGRGRLAAHLIPDHTPILPVAIPIQVYRLMDGRKVAASDHASGNYVYESIEEADKIEGIVTHVIGRCFPVDDTVRLLEKLLCTSGTSPRTRRTPLSAWNCVTCRVGPRCATPRTGRTPCCPSPLRSGPRWSLLNPGPITARDAPPLAWLWPVPDYWDGPHPCRSDDLLSDSGCEIGSREGERFRLSELPNMGT